MCELIWEDSVLIFLNSDLPKDTRMIVDASSSPLVSHVK